MLRPLSLMACSGPVRFSRGTMSEGSTMRPIFSLKYGTIWSSSNSNSLMESPIARYRTLRCNSLSRAVRSSMRTMSENPERMTE